MKAEKVHWSKGSRFAILGALIGGFFPVAATLLMADHSGVSYLTVHFHEPVLLFLDALPVILGILGLIFGQKIASLEAGIERNRAFVHAVPGVISWVSSDLHYLGANRHLASLLDMEPDEIVGKPVGFRQDNPLFSDLMKSVFDSDSNQIATELCQSIGGEDHYFLFVAQKYNDGREAVMVGIDISELKAAERTISEQREKILSSAQLTEIGLMSSGIAHDISNPLAVILLNSNLLGDMASKDQIDAEMIQKVATKIENNSKRISDILEGLRVISKDVGSDMLKTYPLLKVVKEGCTLLKGHAKNFGISIDIDVPEDIELECRKAEVSKVILNLVNNACEAANEQEEKWVKIGASGSGDDIEITITDSGPGIPAEVRERILEPFYSTKGESQGTGMGLAVSLRMIENCGGSLSIDETSPNTTFVLKLPRVAPTSQDIDQAA